MQGAGSDLESSIEYPASAVSAPCSNDEPGTLKTGFERGVYPDNG